MSKLIIMSGPAGAGKSTYAYYLLYTETPGLNAIVISSDDIRDEVYGGKFPGVFNKDKEKRVWEVFIERTKEASKQNDLVILDSTCLTNKKRLSWYNEFRDYFDEFVLVLLNKPLEVCIEQDSKRNRHVPAKDIQKQINIFQKPNEKVKELFEVIYV